MEHITRAYIATLTVLSDAFRRVFAPQTQLVPARARRGAGLVEYMLLGALAVLLFITIRGVLNGSFSTVVDRIREALTGPA